MALQEGLCHFYLNIVCSGCIFWLNLSVYNSPTHDLLILDAFQISQLQQTAGAAANSELIINYSRFTRLRYNTETIDEIAIASL